MQNKKAIIIQARMGSTRLPGKVLKNLWNGMSTLDILIRRLKPANVDDIIVATTTNPLDDEIVYFCKERGITCFRGEEGNVIKRVVYCAIKHKVDIIVEVTADCPFVDFQHINEMLSIFNFHDYDYISNCFPRSWADGLDVQIFKRKLLDHAWIQINPMSPEHYLHCGWNIINNIPKGKYNITHYPAPIKYNRPDMGLTLDEPKDLELIRKIFSHFNRIDMTAEEIMDYVLANPGLLEINKNVERKIPGDG